MLMGSSAVGKVKRKFMRSPESSWGKKGVALLKRALAVSYTHRLPFADQPDPSSS